MLLFIHILYVLHGCKILPEDYLRKTKHTFVLLDCVLNIYNFNI